MSATSAERWEATTPVTGDYARDCAELAREALSHVGFTRFEETPFEDVLACCEGDLPVTVAVLPVPVEGFEMTLDDLQSLIDEDASRTGRRSAWAAHSRPTAPCHPTFASTS